MGAFLYNNIVSNPTSYFVYMTTLATSNWYDKFKGDHNIYYPNADTGSKFYCRVTGGASPYPCNFTLWKSRLSAGSVDVNSLTSDPKFVSGSPTQATDFQLDVGSPAIDAGEDVGLSYDFGGNVVSDTTPNIGAWENR